MGLWLIVAAWAKLPAILFAPAAALALVQAAGGRRAGGRRWRAWVGVGVAAVVTWLAVAAWYRINPFMPLPGLRRISEHTNHVMASWGELAGPFPARVTLARLVLALTTPGLALALVGWVFMQGRPGQRLWINAWFLLGLIFALLTVQANTYWIYAVVPAGCLLGGLAVVEFWRRARWSVVPLAVAGAALFWLCPGVAQVREYLLTHPEYQAIREISNQKIKSGPVLYYGQTTNDLLYFAGKPGLGVADLEQDQILNNLRSGRYPYLLSNRMAGDDVLAEVFTLKPVLATCPGEYILFDASRPAALGEAIPAPAASVGPALNLDLGGALKVVSAQAAPAQAAPGGLVTLNIAFAKGTNYTKPPLLGIEFLHQVTGEAFPVPPTAGGATLDTWVLPQLQAPVFDRPDAILTMHYAFTIPAHLPAGMYDARLSLLEDRHRPAVQGQPLTVPLGLKILPPASLARLPLVIRPQEAIWRLPSFTREPSWLGRPIDQATLTSDGHLWLRPSLPPGDYIVEVTGRGIPVGAGQQALWPKLRLQKPGQTEERMATFDAPAGQTQAFRIRWFGAEDFLHFSIGNPAVDARERQPFPLYLDAAGGTRSIAIDHLTVRQAR